MNEKVDKAILDEIKSGIENGKFPFVVKGIVIFGSRVKGKATPRSDFDLLVVADGINPKRQRRGEEILLLKKALPPVPLDITLLTPEETVSNFKNHNPLFLDIAVEGIIVSDEGNFLRNLMEETREYIKSRGLKKWKDGWVFPVEKGVVYLSKVSNKDFAMAMVKDGERDYLIGIKLLEEGFYDKSVYHFQQSVEKGVKSVLIALGIFQKTHFVGEILSEAIEKRDMSDSWKRKLNEIAEISQSIEPDVSLSRYPGIVGDTLWLPFEEYEREDADRAKNKAEKTLEVAKEFLTYWFSGDS